MKRALITGVAGLIGSHLADKMLENGYSVTGVDDLSAGRLNNLRTALENRKFRFMRFDASRKAEVVKKLGASKFDVVVHLAASKKIGEAGSSLKVLTNNLDSTVNMLELARKNKAKFIFASTSDVYGVSADLPFREDGDVVLGPSYIKRWSYAVSKLYCEHLVFAYHHDLGMPVVVLRYFGCFSSRSNYGPSGGHVPMFIKRALDGKNIVIHGDGSQTRSMTHVSDVVKGTFLAIESKKAVGQIINIGSDEEISVKGSADIILGIAKKLSPKAGKVKLEYVPMKDVFGDYKEIRRRIPSLKKAGELLGYKPQADFRKAVKMVAVEMMR